MIVLVMSEINLKCAPQLIVVLVLILPVVDDAIRGTRPPAHYASKTTLNCASLNVSTLPVHVKVDDLMSWHVRLQIGCQTAILQTCSKAPAESVPNSSH